MLQNFAKNSFFTLHQNTGRVFYSQKTLKMTISTSVWHAHHPNAGQNIQQRNLNNNEDSEEHINHFSVKNKIRIIQILFAYRHSFPTTVKQIMVIIQF